MPAQPGPGPVRYEAERLGACRADHLVDIDAHAIAHDLHLVHKANVHRTVDVLEQLGHFGDAGRAHGHDLVNDLPVEREPDLQAGGGCPAADFRDGTGGETRLAGGFAPGGEAPEDIPAAAQAR